MSSVTSDPLVGRTVDGRYDVRRRVARGGMATVYLAHDRRLDRLVALKVMHPHLAEGSDVEARFRREARAAARLAHPGIVAVLDQGIDGGTSYLTMEYVPGHTLRTEIAGKGALRLGQALEITEGILDALASAHRAGLVHRDMKPENVLITRDGRVKIGDFGLARAVTEATVATTGTLLGTVAYLSPEIISSGTADARTDVYAVGIMLWEMLTGRPPFEGSTPIQIAYRHVNEDVPAPSELVPWLPYDVDELVAAFTAREPSERVPDAAAALELLRTTRSRLGNRAMSLRADVPAHPELLVDHPDVSPEELASATEKLAEEIGREETAALDREPGTGTIALPIGAVPGARADGAVEADESAARGSGDGPTQVAPRSRRRHRGLRWILAILLVLLVAAGGGAVWWFVWGPGSPVLVPHLAGLTLEEAEARLEQFDLVPGPDPDTVFDDDAPAGTVLGSDPGMGTSLDRGSTVELTLSAGIEEVEVPRLVGLTQAEAEAALTEARLVLGEVDVREDREVAEGEVLAASAQPGDLLPHDSEVNLVVSSGPRRVSIPEDYVGKNADVVVNDLMHVLDIGENEITVTETFDDAVPSGHVVSVTPAPGSTDIPQGTPAAVVVSKGPELFEVPNVNRKSVEEAKKILEDAGFRVETKSSWGGLTGLVVSQDPRGGTMLPRGSLVTITYV